VRSSVNDAMKTLRADLAAAARDARADARDPGRRERSGTGTSETHTEGTDDPRVQARMALRDAEAAINDFRQELRSDLRTKVAEGRLDREIVELISTGLTALRREITEALRR
jgi:hypothetical protein